MKLLCVVGARPNFIKIAPIIAACRAVAGVRPVLVHTGQHYDREMSDVFFRQLGIPEPDVNLGVGSGSHAVQTAEIMKAFEPVVIEEAPDVVLVVGDVNSTIACGLVAVKLGVRLAHVEAGLRSFDRTMPEEINRILTDAISDALFVTEQSGIVNLRNEGVEDAKVFFVGNVMIDTLLANREKAEASDILNRLGLDRGGYAVLTLHRPSNVDDEAALGRILDALEVIGREMPIVFPIHPRTRRNLEQKKGTGAFCAQHPPGLQAKGSCPLFLRVGNLKGLRLVDPLGYLDFLKLTSAARIVLTDSGGIQEETTILKVPCLTLRENTERPVTIACGSSRLVGSDTQRILSAYNQMKTIRPEDISTPELWDGQAAGRIVKILHEKLGAH